MNKSESGKLGYLKAKNFITEYIANQHAAAVAAYKIKYCPKCNTIIPYEKRDNKHCSRECAAAASNDRRKIARYCLICTKKLIRQQLKYCSHKCSHLALYREYIDNWIKGLESGGNKYGVSAYVRRWLVEQFGEQCVLCGWNKRHPITGLIPVQVDHINGNGLSHRPDNLRLLCPSCHSLTPTWGGLNVGSGRKIRLSSTIGSATVS